jgi:Tfp pilus assembly protein PilV
MVTLRRSTLSSEKGLGLVEVMIATGIIGVVALGITSIAQMATAIDSKAKSRQRNGLYPVHSKDRFSTSG